MPELLQLYLTFARIGLVNFGGGYAMLPLLERELVNDRGWCTTDELMDYFAIGQCTPGLIALNVSTFIGNKRKGVLGGITATLGFVTCPIIIILLIAMFLTNFADLPIVKNALEKSHHRCADTVPLSGHICTGCVLEPSADICPDILTCHSGRCLRCLLRQSERFGK